MSVGKCFVNLKNLYKYLQLQASCHYYRSFFFYFLPSNTYSPVLYNIHFKIVNEAIPSILSFGMKRMAVQELPYSDHGHEEHVIFHRVAAATHEPPKTGLKPMSQINK